MAEVTGVDGLEKLFGFGVDIVVDVVNIVAAGKFGLSDALHLLSLVKTGTEAFKSVAQAKAELAGITEAQKAVLLAYLESRLSINSAVLKGYIDQAIQAIMSVLDLYSSIKPKVAPAK